MSDISLVGFLSLKTRNDRFEVCQVKRPYGPAYGECTSGGHRVIVQGEVEVVEDREEMMRRVEVRRVV